MRLAVISHVCCGMMVQCLSRRTQSEGHVLTRSSLEVCMGMGDPMGLGFPWDSHVNWI